MRKSSPLSQKEVTRMLFSVRISWLLLFNGSCQLLTSRTLCLVNRTTLFIRHLILDDVTNLPETTFSDAEATLKKE